MLLNCGVGEDSWESLGLQGEPTSPSKGNQSWIFTGRTDVEGETLILWPPDVKNWLIGKDPDVGRDWGQEATLTKCSQFTSLTGRPVTSCTPNRRHWERQRIASLLFWTKTRILNISMRKHQTDPNRKPFQKITHQYVLSVKAVKDWGTLPD